MVIEETRKEPARFGNGLMLVRPLLDVAEFQMAKRVVARDISDVVQDGGVHLGEDSATSASQLNEKTVYIIMQCAIAIIVYKKNRFR